MEKHPLWTRILVRSSIVIAIIVPFAFIYAFFSINTKIVTIVNDTGEPAEATVYFESADRQGAYWSDWQTISPQETGTFKPGIDAPVCILINDLPVEFQRDAFEVGTKKNSLFQDIPV